MSSSKIDAIVEPEARIVYDATSRNFVRISLQELWGDGRIRFVNLNKLMNGLETITLPKGGYLRRWRSGGLYLYGSPAELAELLASKGYKTVSIRDLSGSSKKLISI